MKKLIFTLMFLLITSFAWGESAFDCFEQLQNIKTVSELSIIWPSDRCNKINALYIAEYKECLELEKKWRSTHPERDTKSWKTKNSPYFCGNYPSINDWYGWCEPPNPFNFEFDNMTIEFGLREDGVVVWRKVK